MKRLLLILAFISVLFTQCEPEKSIQSTEVKSKELVNNLEKDEDFIKLHLASSEMSFLVYEKQRELGSNNERLKSTKRLEELFKAERNEENFNLIINELGFTKKEFADIFLEVSKSKNTLEKRYGQNFLTTINTVDLGQVLSKIESNNASKFRDRIRVCTRCPFNNCAECAEGAPTGGTGGGYNSNEDDAGGTGGSGGCNQSCLNGATGKRNGAKNIAQWTLMSALGGCQLLAVNSGTTIAANSWVLSILGPEAPIVVGVVGAAAVDIWCMVTASWVFHNTIQVIEGDFLIDKAGCGC